MGEKIFLALIAKSNLPEIAQLIEQLCEKLDQATFEDLINKLAEHDFIDHLKLLLNFVNKKSEGKEKKQLCCRIHHKLLISNLNNFNQEQIISHLQQLNTLLLNEPAYDWQEILTDIIKWIERHPLEEFKQLLVHLPATPREKLYQLLLEMLVGKTNWLNGLIDFVIVERKTSPEMEQHVAKLAQYLLLAPLDCDISTIQSLSLHLPIEQLVTTTFKLRAIAAAYAEANTQDKKKQARNITLRRIYLHNYDILATVLTARATDTSVDYQALAKSKPELANLLIGKRLQAPDNNTHDKKLLVKELLDDCALFNWQDSQFSELATNSIVAAFQDLKAEELHYYFGIYYKHCFTTNRDIGRLIDRMHEKFTSHYGPEEGVGRIIACFNANDNEDNTLTINYLTRCQVQDNFFYGECLNRLSITQLTAICCHVAALRQLMQNKQTPLLEIYGNIFCEKIIANARQAAFSFAALAPEIAKLELHSQQELIATLFKELHDHAQLKYACLDALVASTCIKTTLFPYCRALFKTCNAAEKLALLEKFDAESVFNLYLYLINEHADEQEFAGLIALLKDTSRQPILVLILTNTPLVQQSFLDNLLLSIHSKDLILLIERLIEKTRENSEYANTLNQLLLYFCSRLQSLDHNDSIHHWTLCTEHVLIAKCLLNNPVCLDSLSKGLSWFAGLEYDLKLRATRLFDFVPSSEVEAHQAALSILTHFRQQPFALQNLFKNLEAVKAHMSDEGKKHYSLLKKACWVLLTGDENGNYEKYVDQLLTTQLGTAQRFDGVLAQLTKNLSSNNSQLGAHYLTQIDDWSLQQIDQETLITILCKSMDSPTKVNWQKATSFLRTKATDYNIAFVQSLIKKTTDSNNNPLLNHQVWSFITNLSDFTTLLPHLDNPSLHWLVKHCCQEFLLKQFSTWFNTLLRFGDLRLIDWGGILALLPQEHDLLQPLMQDPSLTDYLPQIFVTLASHEATTAHLVTLHDRINQLDGNKRRALIHYVHQNLPASSMVPTAASVLNKLIINLSSSLQIQKKGDVQIVINQLKFFHKWADSLPETSPQYASYLRELRQLIFNLISSLKEYNPLWTKRILKSKAFAELACVWLPTDSKHLDNDPFTALLLTNITVKLHPQLLNSKDYQHYIKQLLLHPPQGLEDEQFALLFQTLMQDEQVNFAKQMLRQVSLDNVQWSALLIVACVLPARELFTIYQQSQTRFIFVDLLVRHPEGIASLSVEEKSTLLDHLESGKQLLRILDSQTAVKVKFDFVNAIFAYLEHRKIPLNGWFERLNIDGQTLAAFANYTNNPARKEQLFQVIKPSQARIEHIKYYLQQPSLDMHIEPQGLLYDYLSQAWCHPQYGCQCAPDTVKMLQPKKTRIALHRQLRFLLLAHQLGNFYKPLAEFQEAADKMLLAARWIHRLPLLTDGLLRIIEEGQKSPAEIYARLQETALYKRFILPLPTSNNHQEMLEIQLDELFDLLNEYAQFIAQKNLANIHPTLKDTLDEYQLKLSAIEQMSSLQLLDLFNPHSYFAKTKKGTTTPLLALETMNLAKASELHQRTLAKHLFTPQKYLQAVLDSIASDPTLLADNHVQTWLLDECLFSPLLEPWNNVTAAKLLAEFPTKELTANLQEKEETFTIYQACFTKLSTFNTCRSIKDLLKELKALDDRWLHSSLKACEFAQLPYLASVLLLAIQLKKNNLPMQSLLLPKSLSNGLEMDWVAQDLRQLDQRKRFLSQRMHEIKIAAYSYHNHATDHHRLQHLKDNFSQPQNVHALAQCLNTYLPAFNRKDPTTADGVVASLEGLLTTTVIDNTKLLSQLNPQLVDKIVHFACDKVDSHEQLLQQFIAHGLGASCETVLSTYLRTQLQHYIKPLSNNSHTLADLNSLQLAQIPKPIFKQLLIVQRLLLMINPSPELVAWKNSVQPTSQLSRVFFCSNASLYALIMQMEQQSLTAPNEIAASIKGHLHDAFTLLRKEADAPYLQEIDKEFRSNPCNNMAVNYHYACLSSFLHKDKTFVLNTFVSCLKQIDCQNFSESQQLQRLLERIPNDLLPELSQQLRLVTLDDTKYNWLFTQAKAAGVQRLGLIMSALPWPWLQKKITAPMEDNLLLLNLALQQYPIIVAIRQNPQNCLGLLQLLQNCRIDLETIRAMQQEQRDPAIRSLLALYCLNSSAFFKTLSGTAFLPSSSSTLRIKKRLQPLIEQLDYHHLSAEFISSLQPEAAASVLCAPQFFHHLDEGAIKLLIHKSGKGLINYWLRFYSTMPNCHHLLLFFITLFPAESLQAIKALDIPIKQQLLMTIIEYAEKFNDNKIKDVLTHLLSHCNESHLILAVNYYLHDASRRQTLVPFIKSLLENLPKAPPLSITATNLLIRITEDEAFAFLSTRFSQATSDYLRNYAALGDCSLFYDCGKFSLQRAQKSLVDSNGETLQSIDYFIMHYRGDIKPLRQLLYDYLQQQEEPSALQQTAALLLNDGVLDAAKPVLFETLLRHKQGIDGQIDAYLLRHDATTTIKTVGIHKNYHAVMQLYKNSINYLKDHPPTQQIITAAAKEALFEENLSTLSWFKSVRIWIKRCFFYGWSGLFKAKQAQFVIPFDNSDNTPSNNEVIEEDSINFVTTAAPKLQDLFNTNSQDPSDQLTIFHDALQRYEFQAKDNQEIIHRSQIESLFNDLQNRPALAEWLVKHDKPFIRNREKLIALLCSNADWSALKLLFAQMKDNAYCCKAIKEELYASDKEIPTIPAATTTSSTATPGILETVGTFFTQQVTKPYTALGNLTAKTQPG